MQGDLVSQAWAFRRQQLLPWPLHLPWLLSRRLLLVTLSQLWTP